MTLVEVLLATVLLAIAAVPIVQVAARGQETAQEVRNRTRATLLAEQKMETILAAVMADYTQNPACTSQSLGGGYLATVVQTTRTSTTKTLTVQVGLDANGNGALESGEVMVTLGTIVVDTGG